MTALELDRASVKGGVAYLIVPVGGVMVTYEINPRLMKQYRLDTDSFYGAGLNSSVSVRGISRRSRPHWHLYGRLCSRQHVS